MHVPPTCLRDRIHHEVNEYMKFHAPGQRLNFRPRTDGRATKTYSQRKGNDLITQLFLKNVFFFFFFNYVLMIFLN